MCKHTHICRIIDKHTNLWLWRRLGTRNTQPYFHDCGQGGFSKCGHKKGRPISEARGTACIQNLPPCAAIWCPLWRRNPCVLISWASVTDMRLRKNKAKVCKNDIKCDGAVRYIWCLVVCICARPAGSSYSSRKIYSSIFIWQSSSLGNALLIFPLTALHFLTRTGCILFVEFSNFLRILDSCWCGQKKKFFNKNWRVSISNLGHKFSILNA